MCLQQQLRKKLEQAFDPVFLEVINESHLHEGHAGDDGSGESHFQIIMTAHVFDEVSRVQRERMVHEVLKEEISKIHALSIQIIQSQ